MPCTRCLDETLLSGLLDGVIVARERQIVRAHLVVCAECRRLLSELGEIRKACITTRFPDGCFARAGNRGRKWGKLRIPVELSTR